MYNSTIPAGDDSEEVESGSKLPNGQSNEDSSEAESTEVSTSRSSVQVTDSLDESLEETTDQNIAKSTAAPGLAEDTTNKILQFEDIPIKAENFSSTLGVYQNCAVCSDREVCSQIGR